MNDEKESLLPNVLGFAVDLPKLVANETQHVAPTGLFPGSTQPTSKLIKIRSGTSQQKIKITAIDKKIISIDYNEGLAAGQGYKENTSANSS
ncbi:MAG: hypothetical protein AAF485_03970 [Chloroflexota bacterium]